MSCAELDGNFDYQLARAEYLFPDTSNPDEKMFIRIMAATRMRDLEAETEAQALLT